MKKLSITLVLPFPVTKPVGGAKNMYEYANRLHANGHTVIILHSIKRPFKKLKTPVWVKRSLYALRGVSRPKWFPLHKDIKSIIVPEITDHYVPDADIIICTWWQMAFAISSLSLKKGKAFNLIQDYEVWKGSPDSVHESYRLPLHHLVIAKYLEEIVFAQSGKLPLLLPSSVDTDKFFITHSIETRTPETIMMLYSEEPRKGTAFGIEALTELKNECPGLSVTFFGVYPKPALPSWITYHQKPGNLPELYNEHAIFFSPSLGEGWGLPPAEAMACGCALVCTEIGGHAYAVEGATALLVQPKAIAEMKQKLKILIKENQQRIELAKRGNEFMVANFSFSIAIKALEKYFYEALGETVTIK